MASDLDIFLLDTIGRLVQATQAGPFAQDANNNQSQIYSDIINTYPGTRFASAEDLATTATFYQVSSSDAAFSPAMEEFKADLAAKFAIEKALRPAITHPVFSAFPRVTVEGDLNIGLAIGAYAIVFFE